MQGEGEGGGGEPPTEGSPVQKKARPEPNQGLAALAGRVDDRQAALLPERVDEWQAAAVLLAQGGCAQAAADEVAVGMK